MELKLKKQNYKKKEESSFNPYDKRFIAKHDVPTILLILVVCFLQCMVLSYFYVPYHFLSGGVTGLSMLFNYVFDIPNWVILVGFNIPITIFGIKYQSLKFSLFSMLGTLCFAFMFEIPIIDKIAATGGLGEGNELLAAAVGSAIIGVTSAPIVKRGASLGGIDVIAVILSRRLSIPAGSINIIFNLIIMSFLIQPYGIEIALLSMIAMFVCNSAFNFAMRGVNHNMTVFIISDEWDEIAPHVMKDMNRGVTYINAEGAYTGQPRKLVYCIVKTTELAKLKKIVKDHDPHALFSIIETQDVVGRGFGSIN